MSNHLSLWVEVRPALHIRTPQYVSYSYPRWSRVRSCPPLSPLSPCGHTGSQTLCGEDRSLACPQLGLCGAGGPRKICFKCQMNTDHTRFRLANKLSSSYFREVIFTQVFRHLGYSFCPGSMDSSWLFPANFFKIFPAAPLDLWPVELWLGKNAKLLNLLSVLAVRSGDEMDSVFGFILYVVAVGILCYYVAYMILSIIALSYGLVWHDDIIISLQ